MDWSWLTIFHWIEWLIRLGMLLIILGRRLAPTVSLAWLCLIFFEPVVGLAVYLLIGNHRLARRRIRLHREFLRSRAGDLSEQAHKSHVTRPPLDPAQQQLVLQAECIGGMDIIGGSDMLLIDTNEQLIHRLVADLDAAIDHAHLLYYIFAPDDTGRRVADALARAARRGVACRLLVDAVGSRSLFGRKGLARWLEDHGVRVVPALPVNPIRRPLARIDLRNHRKLAVIDGRIAYAGSHNIVNPDYGHPRAGIWIDLTARFTGPIVAELQSVFLDDWAFETDQPPDQPNLFPTPTPTGDIAAQCVPTGPSQHNDTLQRVLIAAINSARHRLLITSPYLVPDEPTTLALAMAVDRGAEVSIVLPQRSDHPLVNAAARAHFDELLASGVNLYLYQPAMLHAKTMTVDDSFALLGSSNLDIRSFYLNFELNVLLYGPAVTASLRFAQQRYIADSLPIDRPTWARRPAIKRYLDSAAALASPLL